MRSFNVVGPVIASCLWLAACGSRSGVQCFNGVCVSDDDVGTVMTGAGGTSGTTLPPRSGGAGRPDESPPDNEGMSEPRSVDSNFSICPESPTARGPITITTRAELAQLEGCPGVEGDLRLIGLRVRDLSLLRALTVVTGTFLLDMSGSLSGLENLTSVGHLNLMDLDAPTLAPLANLASITGTPEQTGGQLVIHRSPNLQNLEGLGSLRAVDNIEISGNDGLESLDGLGVPSELKELRILDNLNLRELAALFNLASIDRLELQNNAALTELRGLDGVVAGGTLHISNSLALQDISALRLLGSLDSLFVDNVGLTNLDGLASLLRVQEIVLQGNPNLTQVDALAPLQSVNHLVVTDNPSLVRLPNIPSIREMGRVLVRGNGALASGPSFPGLLETTTLTISENPLLTRVDGFPELRTVRTVEVSENQALLELDLSAVENVTRVRILCNPNLPEGSLTALLSLGSVEVRGNLGSASACDSGGPR